MNVRYLPVGIFVILSSLAHAAVPTASHPSDVDIHAAYCAGTEEQEASWENAAASASSNPKLVDFYRRTAAAAQARIARLHHYLDERFGPAEPIDIVNATKRGLADAESLVSDSQVQACTKKCRHLSLFGNTADEVKRCMAPCDERLPRIWSCKELSWLP